MCSEPDRGEQKVILLLYIIILEIKLDSLSVKEINCLYEVLCAKFLVKKVTKPNAVQRLFFFD